MTTKGSVDILIVDDRPDGLLALEAVLKGIGDHVVKASSGREALALLPEHEFAVILLDVQMPDLDGFETAKFIKEDERGKQVPIIFITAIDKEKTHVYRGYHSGAVDYIFKPFNPDILRFKVATFVDLCRMRKQVEDQSQRLLEIEKKEREFRITQLQLQNLQRYRNLADAIPHMVWKAQSNGTMDYVNEYWCKYTGLTEEQSKGRGWQSQLHPEDLKKLMIRWAGAEASRENVEMECRIRRADHSYRWHLIRFVPELESDIQLCWIGTCTDIHELKEAKEMLVQLNDSLETKVDERTRELYAINEALQSAQKEIVEISEKERSRLGQDLHDGLAQELAGACFIIQSIKNHMNEEDVMKTEKSVVTALQLLKNAQENCRRLARNLYPIELERYGLPMAMKEIAMTATKIFDTHCEFVLEGPEPADDNEIVKTQLYRIVQEAVQNAVRHSKAKQVRITMSNFVNELVLQVQDDGIGMAEQESSQGMGFRIMRHRAQMIGAVLSVSSKVQKGTLIRCVWSRSRPLFANTSSFDTTQNSNNHKIIA